MSDFLILLGIFAVAGAVLSLVCIYVYVRLRDARAHVEEQREEPRQ